MGVILGFSVIKFVQRALAIVAFGLAATSCSGPSSSTPPSYFLSHRPENTNTRMLRHYPVARQGDLTVWLTSDHVWPSEKSLFSPDDPSKTYPIVGKIRAKDMPQAAKHDGAFLVASGYDGPLFDLWEGGMADVLIFTGRGGWVPAKLNQTESVNSWVRLYGGRQVGGWSGYPVVIGDPNKPDAVAGAMWYKSNTEPQLGGVTSTRMLKAELKKLRFADFVRK